MQEDVRDVARIESAFEEALGRVVFQELGE